MKTTLGLLLVIAAIAVAWLALRSGTDDADLGAHRSTPPEDAAPAAAAPAAATRPAPELEPASEPAPQRQPAGAVAADSTVTLRGRCVDASGAPLSGCTVRVGGWIANSERMEKHTATHGEVRWQDPPRQTTGADGVFSFTFVPPPPYQFTLDVTRPALLTMSGRWSELTPGTKDVGDVPLRPGTVVSGRVVDTDSTPQDKVEINLNLVEARARVGGDLAPRRYFSARTIADGTFRFEEPLSPATWRVAVRGQLLRPTTLELKEGEPSASLELVVRKPSDIPAITGTVRDEAGAPVHNATIEYEPRGAGTHSTPYTDREGRFRIERSPQDPDGPVQIAVEREGFERLQGGKHAWGATDVELVLRRGLWLEIFVTERDSGKPIEEFAVRCFPEPGSTSRLSSQDYRLRSKGRHPGGTLRLAGIPRGRHLLLVQATDPGWCVSAFQRFELTDGGAPVQHVRLSRPSARVLQVVRKDGSPVSGTAVELLRGMTSGPVSIKTGAVELEQLYGGSSDPDKAMLLQKGTTGADGQLELSGPPGEELAVRLLGPGHEPIVVQPVALDPDLGPLRVEVPSGATLSGTFRPLEALRQFHPPAEFVAERSKDERQKRRLLDLYPGVRLMKPGNFRETYPTGPTTPVPIAEDGSFVLAGIPPGTWELQLVVSSGFSKNSYSSGGESLQTLELGEGEERKLDIDIGHLVYGRIEGRVTRNGDPLAGARLHLQGTRPDGSGGRRPVQSSSAPVKTDAEGRFAADVVPARYLVLTEMAIGGRPFPGLIPAAEVVEVTPSSVVRQEFHVRVGKLRLRALASDGKTPLPGIELQMTAEDRSSWADSRETDKDGWCVADPTPLGRFVVRVWPTNLATQEARSEHWKKNQGAPLDAAMIQVATLDLVTENEELVRELVLPAASGY